MWQRPKVCARDGTINGNVVIVSSPEIKQPIAVRFGWSDTAKPNLVNGAGLPASPFRTDDFPLNSVGAAFEICRENRLPIIADCRVVFSIV